MPIFFLYSCWEKYLLKLCVSTWYRYQCKIWLLVSIYHVWQRQTCRQDNSLTITHTETCSLKYESVILMVLPPSCPRNGDFYQVRRRLLYKMSSLIYVSLLLCEIYCQFKQQVIRWKTSSLQGIVRPPMGWSYPKSSSAWVNKSWNEGWFMYDTGITNRFIFSPT